MKFLQPVLALAVAVAFPVTAGASVFEEDAVLAPAATSAHGCQGSSNGGHSWGPFASHTGRQPAMSSYEVYGSIP
jgi:hypothetical protein